MWWRIDDALEYVVTLNSYVTPSEHLLSLHRRGFWISRTDQMQQISKNIKLLLIQGCVGRRIKSFNLSNLPSLTAVEMGYGSFLTCNSIVFESKNDWINDDEIWLDLNPSLLDIRLLMVKKKWLSQMN